MKWVAGGAPQPSRNGALWGLVGYPLPAFGMEPGHVCRQPRFFPQLPMSKADGDSRARGAAGGGRDAASPSGASGAESKNVKPAASTIQDDIPPVHVLVAAEQQDRKETEALLSGFDRPGRGPKAPPRERDFVDYYAKKPGGGASSGSLRAASGAGAGAAAGGGAGVSAKARDESTVIVRRKGDGAPAWLVWGGAAVLMLLVGGLVAYVATSDGRPVAATPTAPSAASAASAATTLTAATSPKPSVADENIPPPSVVAPSVVAEAPSAGAVEAAPAVAPRGSAKREARGVPSGATPTTTTPAETAAPMPRATSTAAAPKGSPREDFIRDL